MRPHQEQYPTEELPAFAVHRSACLSPAEREAVADFIQQTALEPPPEQAAMDRSAELLAKTETLPKYWQG